METLNLSTRSIEDISLNLEAHIAATLGEPLELPECLADLLSEHWACSEEAEPNLLSLFKLITGADYCQAWRENTYNQDNDLDSFAVVTVYADTACPDWTWRRDCFVVVEIGAGGDPRYSSYGAARIYRLEDCCIGDTSFLEWTIGYWLQPISDDYDASVLDSINDRLSVGYSSYPYGELRETLYAEPIYCESRQAFIARPKNVPFPVIVSPVAPMS